MNEESGMDSWTDFNFPHAGPDRLRPPRGADSSRPENQVTYRTLGRNVSAFHQDLGFYVEKWFNTCLKCLNYH